MKIRCKICGLPENYTGISFDEEGVCNFCNFYAENKEILEDSEKLEGIFLQKMENAKQRARENGAKYDCLVGFSGGKDSTYIIQQLKDVYGMRVLAFTFQNSFSTEYGQKNIENALKKMHVDHVSFSTNSSEMKKMYKFGVNFLKNFCWVCFHYMHYYSYLFAGQNKIPLIVNGRTRGQMLQSAQDKKFLEPFETAHSLLEFEHQMFHGLEEKLWKQEELDYLGDTDIEAVSYFAYHDISDEEVMCTLEKGIGWTRPKFAHDDCFAHAVAENLNIHKCGFPKRQGELAVEVRRGKLTVAEMDRILERDMIHYSSVPEETKKRFERRMDERNKEAV